MVVTLVVGLCAGRLYILRQQSGPSFMNDIQDELGYDDHACVSQNAQEQARALHALGMVDYGEMKARLMLTTAALVAGGSTICWIHGDAGGVRCSAGSADPGLMIAGRGSNLAGPDYALLWYVGTIG